MKLMMLNVTSLLLAGGLLVAQPVRAQEAQDAHSAHDAHAHEAHAHHAGHAHAGTAPEGPLPTSPGQDAFGAIAEIVALLEADPETDWSRVDVGALRDHLVDMNELVLNAEVAEREIEGGVEAVVTGEGRTRGAIQRMVPAHAGMMRGARGWKIEVEKIDGGVRLKLTSDDPAEVARLRGLGFFGFMASGSHHGPHHLAMARGESPHRH